MREQGKNLLILEKEPSIYLNLYPFYSKKKHYIFKKKKAKLKSQENVINPVGFFAWYEDKTKPSKNNMLKTSALTWTKFIYKTTC